MLTITTSTSHLSLLKMLIANTTAKQELNFEQINNIDSSWAQAERKNLVDCLVFVGELSSGEL